MKFPRLFAPLSLGNLTLPNRIVMGAMHTAIDHLDRPYERIRAFYRARAEGEVGMIITGGVSPNAQGRFDSDSPSMTSEMDSEWHRAIVDSVQGTSTRICLQLLHAGRYAEFADCVAPSALRARINRYTPRALSTQEVWQTIDDYARSTEIARDFGYHAVEVMGSEGYLINEFTAPATNHRSDEFGGDLEGRMRFPIEILKAIRQRVGADFPVIYRISALDLVENGMPGDEVLELARRVEQAGASAINIGVGWHEATVPTIAHVVPRAGWHYAARAVRAAVTVPVIASNRINDPQVAEDLLAAGDADLVALARPMLADADFARKARLDQVGQINTCIACNQACLDGYFTTRTVSCLVNPKACREVEFAAGRAPRPLRLAVVGGGAAGMAFAGEAAERGHAVRLFEAADRLGGQLLMAKEIPEKTEFNEMLRYFSQRLVDTGVDVRLRTFAGTAELLSGEYDAIVLATGVAPRRLEIPGIDHPKVLDYVDVLLRKRAVGRRVAIIGAGGIGFDVAEYLLAGGSGKAPALESFATEYGLDLAMERPGGITGARQGHAPLREVTLLQRKSDSFGKGLGATTGWILRDRLQRLGMRTLGGVNYERIDDDGLHLSVAGQPQLLAVDTIVICAGQDSQRGLAGELAAMSPAIPIHLIGGADVASELDARRAIAQAVRLAASL
jgi:2,4-dienoyl-CoA reductase (NADPH2)